jgi:predicted lipid-binding transport protein (Tim44 family)
MLIMAAVAAFILFQLYNVLGKKVGRQPEDNARKAQAALANAAASGAGDPGGARPDTGLDAALMAAAAGLKARDPGFDPVKFLEGARQAYETIVRAYAAGDRETLRPLLAPAVMTSFEAGIAARESRGDKESVEFLHPPRADLEAATAQDDRAQAKVRFLSEIRSRLTPSSGEEVADERRTAEHWTFERAIGASDPNWVLVRVEAASA